MTNLKRCTFTGVDNQTSLSCLHELSIQYSFVEWGVLYSTSEGGMFSQNRYPAHSWLEKNIPELKTMSLSTGSSIALHVCGSAVKALLNEEEEFLEHLIDYVNRVQINFIFKPAKLAALEKLFLRFPHIKFITQHNPANAKLADLISHPSHQVLFDMSGGRGIEADKWDKPLAGKVCGYAGGIGPDNVLKQLKSIDLLNEHTEFWIDMEGKVREHDWFDLKKCEEVLKKIKHYQEINKQ